MNISNSPESQIPNGYLSDKGKQKFTITAGILGAVFFMAQIILPFVLMMIVMPVTMFRNDVTKQLNIDSMVFWNDSIWLIEEAGKNRGYNLKRIKLQEPNKLYTERKLLLEKPNLLAGSDTLWIISPHYVTQHFIREPGQTKRTRYAGNLSKPFLLNDRPAAVRDAPDETSILLYEDGEWNKKFDLNLGPNAKKINTSKNLQVLCDENQMHIFMLLNDTLYYQNHSFDSITDYSKSWEAIGSFGKSWQAVSNGVDLFVFGIRPTYGDRQIVGYKNKDDNWEIFFRKEAQIGTDIGICSLMENEKFILSTQLFPFQLKMSEIKGSKVIKSQFFGSAFPFGSGFRLLFIIPYSGMLILPLILAIILSYMMKKYRNCNYIAESHELPYASLTRRALAQIFDGFILCGPFILSFIFMMISINPNNMLTSNSTWPFLSPFLMCGGFPWMIIWLLIFSTLEGTRGATPGKWLLGIRVMGTDLQPCGFGRAFLRNILKFVDGFFNFLVGVMLAALSHNWQRIGDMAARTVVVDVRSDKHKNTNKMEINSVK
jgi:uncharacterized RDD family membrane protein YckC